MNKNLPKNLAAKLATVQHMVGALKTSATNVGTKAFTVLKGSYAKSFNPYPVRSTDRSEFARAFQAARKSVRPPKKEGSGMRIERIEQLEGYTLTKGDEVCIEGTDYAVTSVFSLSHVNKPNGEAFRDLGILGLQDSQAVANLVKIMVTIYVSDPTNN